MPIHSKTTYRYLTAMFAFISLLLILSQLQVVAAQDDWFMVGHDRQHTGCSPFTGPDTPAVKWTFDLDGGIAGSPVMAADGTIYAGSDHGIFYAINPDGTKKWELTLSGGVRSSAAIGLDGTVYVGTTDGHFYAINPDGTQKWEYITGEIESSPAVGTDGTIYIGTFDNKLYAFNPDGTKKWDFTTGNGINSSPAISLDGTIYVGSQDHKLYALNPDGTEKWEFLTNGPISSSPAIDSDGTVFVGSDDKKLYAINPDGSKKWTFSTGGPVRCSPAIGNDGTVFIESGDAKLTALNSDGSIKRLCVSGVSVAPAIGADGTLYLAGTKLYAMAPQGYYTWDPVELNADSCTSPVIGSDGTIYIGGSNKLHAIGPGVGSNPTIISITPVSSINTGSINITDISGTGFIAGAVVKLSKSGSSDIVATDVTVIHSSKIKCTFDVNGKRTGSWNVVITNPDLKFGVLSNGFDIQDPKPIVDSITPDYAPSDSSVNTTEISGKGFMPGATVKLIRSGANGITAGNVVVVNSSKITCRLDLSAAETGYWDVAVTNPDDQRSVLFNGFYVAQPYPHVNAIVANSAPNSGPVNITEVSGKYFDANATVHLRRPGLMDVVAYNVRIVDSSRITCTFNLDRKPTGSWDVVVTNPNGISGILKNGFTILSSSAASDWWMSGHDAQHTGRSPHVGPAYSNPAWAFEAGGGVSSSPAVASDGTIYVGWENNFLYAINPDGSKKWEFETGDTVKSSPAIGTDGTIYVGSSDNKLYAINSNGSEKWNFGTDGAVLSSPVIASDGTVYFGSMDGSVYAANSDGTMKWEYVTDGEVESSPALGVDGTVYVGSNNGSLYAIAVDGLKKWEFKTGTGQIGSPAIGSDGTIYIGSYDNNLYAINPDGSKKWEFATGNHIVATPAIGSDGIVYVGSRDHGFYAINPDGSIKWRLETGDEIVSSPAISFDGTIYMSSCDHYMYAVDRDGLMMWTYGAWDPIRSSPIIGSNGTLYVGTLGGMLVAINNAPAPWVYSITPNTALNTGPVNITQLIGQGFAPGAIVRLIRSGVDSIEATNVIVVDSTKITCEFDLTGLDTGEWYVEVTNTDDQAGMLWEAFIVDDLSPKVTSITPDNALNTGLVGITQLSGSGFLPDATVKLTKSGQNDIVASTVSIIGSTDITCVFDLNGKESGAWTVVVTNQDGLSGALENGFVVNWVPPVGEWRMFRHDIRHTGRSPFAGPDSPTKLWEFETSIAVQSSPAIGSDGTIYVGSFDNKFYAINPDGSRKWEFAAENAVFSSPAIAPDGTVYVGSYDNKLYALNPDGSEKWSFVTGSTVLSSPTISADGTIYIGSDDTKLYAINPDGSEKWEFATGGGIQSSPAIGSDGTIYVGSADNYLYAIDANGIQKWSFSTGGPITSSPSIASDGIIYVGAYDGLYAITPDGCSKWWFATYSNIQSSPAISSNGTVYIGSQDGAFYAINLDGTMKWKYTFDGGVYSSAAIDSSGVIYVGSDDCRLYAMNPDGSKKWEFVAGDSIESSPTIGSDGVIYVGCIDGKVYAIGGTTVTVDKDSSQEDPTSSPTIKFTAVFSKPVTGFTADGVVLSGTAGAADIQISNPSNGNTTFTISVSGMVHDGTVIVAIPAGAAHDANGAGNGASINYDNSVFYHNATPPTVTINQASDQADPTNRSPINFTVLFSKPVFDFDANGITLGGTSGATAASITNPSGDKMHYAVSVTGMSKSGTLTVSIPAGIAHDESDNGNTASTSTDNTVTYDVDGPVIALKFPTSATNFTRNGNTLTLRGTASDTGGVAEVSCSVIDGEVTSCTGTTLWETADLTLPNVANIIAVNATDNAGNTSVLYLAVNVIDASPGEAWNGLAMVSLPIIPDDIDPKPVVGFAGSGWTSWNPSKSEYTVYATTQNESWFVPRESTIGRGFWARFDSEPVSPIGLVPPQNKTRKIHLYPGWNLIGIPYINPITWDLNSIQVESGGQTMSLANASNIVNSWCWGWDSVDEKYYLVYNPELIPSARGTLEPWLGYWIKAKAECDLVLPTP